MRAADFVESYIDAWNHHDPQAVADHLTADGIYRDVPENAQRTHDELIVTLEVFFADHPHRYELIGDILSNGNTIAFQYRMCPRRDRGGAVRGAEFVTLSGDAAVSIVDYYDRPDIESAETVTSASRAMKYAKSGLGEEQIRDYKLRLEHAVQSGQLYLRPDLTLPKLAAELDCSVNHLSQVINAGFGMSFFDYINRYRIERARELLTSLDAQSAVLNIAYSAGFNSNSAFYAAFKKYVGQTPAQFRRSQANRSH